MDAAKEVKCSKAPFADTMEWSDACLTTASSHRVKADFGVLTSVVTSSWARLMPVTAVSRKYSFCSLVTACVLRFLRRRHKQKGLARVIEPAEFDQAALVRPKLAQKHGGMKLTGLKDLD